jgi:hypothetical protein
MAACQPFNLRMSPVSSLIMYFTLYLLEVIIFSQYLALTGRQSLQHVKSDKQAGQLRLWKAMKAIHPLLHTSGIHSPYQGVEIIRIRLNLRERWILVTRGQTKSKTLLSN